MKFLAGMFGHRRAAPPAEAPALKLSPEAIVRREQERAEAEREAELKRASAEEIERACEAVGFWFPGDSYAPPHRRTLAGRVLGILGLGD